jgi:Tfp pilus assembly PilM family ATPase
LVLAGIEAQWRPLRALLFSQVVLLDLSDPLVLLGQSLKGGKPAGEAWSAPIPARTCRAGVPVALDALGDFIGDLLLEHSSPDAALVVALPREGAHWRVVEWAEGSQPEEAADELRERQVDLGWPFSLEDASLDVHPLAEAPGCSLVVGMSLDALESWIEVFAIAGGSLRHLVPAQVCEQLAIAASLEASAEDDELVALLQPDGTQCQLVVWKAGVPEYQRQLPLEPRALVPALDEALRFCRSRLGAETVRLVMAESLEASDAIRDQLALPLNLVDCGGYGSLPLAGLAALELGR